MSREEFEKKPASALLTKANERQGEKKSPDSYSINCNTLLGMEAVTESILEKLLIGFSQANSILNTILGNPTTLNGELFSAKPASTSKASHTCQH